MKAAVQKNSRDFYRARHPREPNGLEEGNPVTEPKLKEICLESDMLSGSGHWEQRNCYTVPEAAKALCKTPLTFKKWIAQEWVPAPIYVDAVFRYRHYTEEEVQAIAKVLQQHYITYEYVHNTHQMTFAAIRAAFDKLRK